MNKEAVTESLEIEKIIVSPEDELVDILKEIEKTKAHRIILTFAEPSDILISPINLKVVQDIADDLKKPLITLIIQDPIGIRNAKEAGMTVTQTSGSIIDSFWEQAEVGMNNRVQLKEENLKRTNAVKAQKKSEKQEAQTSEAKVEAIPLTIKPPEEIKDSKSEFQKTIEEALDKSKQGIDNKKKVIQENGIVFALDQDIAGEEAPSMIGRNFKEAKKAETDTATAPTKQPKAGFVFPTFKIPKLNLSSNAKGLWAKLGIGLLAVLALASWLMYSLLPLVKVKIFVESKNVSIEKVFAGDLKTAEFSVEKGTVPVKKEEVEKSASNSTKATGTGYKGTKAEGVVQITYYDFVLNGNQIATLKAGTVATSQTGLKFEITTETVVGEGGDIIVDAPVRALAVGEEYNLAAGQYFTIKGYTSDQMSGGNAEPFEGGSKTPYTVLSKADVDKVVNDLKKNLIAEAEGELKSKIDSEWEIVDKSLKSDLDGEAQTDVPIGAEADLVNVSIKIKSSALFFQKSQIDNAVGEMLTKAANDQNLFNDSGSDQLSLDENITKEIKITELKKDSIKVRVTASSNIQPEIDQDGLIAQLKGKGWSEGLGILNAQKFTAQDNQAEFLPEYFPEWLRYFPSRQGRIFVIVEELKAE
ncbi:hypothetical protein IT417_00540 [bacterium]|nr:hypothetical protein [bacterium]